MDIKMALKSIGWMCIVLASTWAAQAKEWRGLVPLHSTRADVERFIGLPSESNSVIAYYHLEDETVTIQYTTRGCVDGYEWNVPPETVLSIVVYPKVKPRLLELDLDLTKFKEEANTHLADIVYLVNKEDGMSVETRPNEETVNSISYMPTTRDAYLRCPASRDKKL